MEIINASEAAQLLRAHGMSISPEAVRMGLAQRQFPWGYCVMDGQRIKSCGVFAGQLRHWIEEKGGYDDV